MNLAKKRDLFYENLFIKYKNNMKSTWQVINKLLGKTKKSNGIALQCNNKILHELHSNKFNNYISNIAENIRKEIPTETKKNQGVSPISKDTSKLSYIFILLACTKFHP